MTDLRRASLKDIPAMARIVADWSARTDWMTVKHDAETLADFIREAFPAREIWVAGDPVAGYMSIDPTADKIGALYCGATGQGIGKAFIDKAKEGRDFLWLTTHQPNLAAQRFYRREGFEIVEALPASEDGGPPEYRMEWLREVGNA